MEIFRLYVSWANNLRDIDKKSIYIYMNLNDWNIIKFKY